MVLARLLSPSEYGIVARVTVFTTFFSIFSDLGVGVAYIQKDNLSDSDRDSIFSFMVVVGIGLYLAFVLLGRGISWFYGDTVYNGIAWGVGLIVVMAAINVVPSSDLLKRHKFIFVNIVNAIATTISAIIAIFMAKNGFSYYALITQSVLNIAIPMVVFLLVVRPKFSFRISRSSLGKVYEYSLGQLGFNFINYFSRNLDNLLVGKVFGETQLGYYDKAYKTTTYVMTNSSSIIGSSIQPVLARKQDDREYVFYHFKKTYLFLVVIGTWAALACALCSREIIEFLYGEQWECAIGPFVFLGISLFSQMPLSCSGAFFQVLNETILLAKTGFVGACILCTGIVIGLTRGTITDVAKWYMIAQLVAFIFMNIIFEHKLFKKSFKIIYEVIVKEIVVFFLVFGLCKYLFINISIESTFILLVVKFMILSILYLLFNFSLCNGKYIVDVFKKERRE